LIEQTFNKSSDEMLRSGSGEVEKLKQGRPRSEKVHKAILETALRQAFAMGFRAVSIESIAAEAGVGKPTIYRRWPNKAAVVMDAFLVQVEPGTVFPAKERAIDSLRLQMLSQVKAFRGKFGRLIKALLGEAQFDPEMAEAFRERWIMPRRRKLRTVIEEAMRQGDFRKDIDPELAMDMLHAPIYYRLQIGSGPLSESFVNGLLEQARKGLEP
jgi:AcrR family transcriptional regulator